MSNIVKNLLKLGISGKTVFNIDDLMLIWNMPNKNVLRVTINRCIKNGLLIQIKRGVYGLKDREVNISELAGKLKKRSYISFETVLAKEGVIFQWHDEFFSAADRSKIEENKYGKFVYRAIPESVLYSNEGIINKGNYFIATKERALCDKIYKDGIVYFDDLSGIDKNKVFKIAKLYNKRLQRDINKLFKL